VTLTDPKTILLAALLVVTAVFVSLWARASWWRLATGFVTNFFDTLGIGSFATTTTLFRLRKLVADEYIPGTLNVGHALPTVAQALIYIAVVEVDFTTLSLLIVSAIAGSWIGAEIVTGLPRGAIQRGMGIALLVASVLMAMTALDRFPGGGTALG
jgi:uncharacterized membrane protein YfcA